SSLVVEAYEYVPDSEIASSIVATSLTTGSEEDLLSPKETPIFDTDVEESAPEIIKTLPQLVPTKDGELTRLEVKVKGKPKPKGKWYKQGVEIIPSQEFQIEEFEDGTSVLTIAETFPDDTGEIVFEAYNPLGVSTTMTYLSVEGILGTKEYRKPEWVTHMEEMQEALRGKNRTRRLDVTDCMLNDAECSYSSDSLDDRALKDESSQRDSSTVISEFSSTRTLMNIDNETDAFVEPKANNVGKYDFAVEEIPSTSSVIDLKDNSMSILNTQDMNIKHQKYNENMIEILNTSKQLPVDPTEYKKNFAEFPSMKHEKKIQEYQSPIEEKSETAKMSDQRNPD
ncbi:hypothetical protein DMN91_005896, partial [Ooceraea biroi]